MDPCMLGDKFYEFLPLLVQVINSSIVFMLDNIMHQKVQCLHQITKAKDAKIHPLNGYSYSLTIYCIINDYLNHIRRTNIINGFSVGALIYFEKKK